MVAEARALTIFKFWSVAVRDFDEYRAFKEFFGSDISRFENIERSLFVDFEPFSVDGYCAICSKNSRFSVNFDYSLIDSYGFRFPNWREHLVCEHCHLNNRMRAAIQFTTQILPEGADCHIYLTENITPLYKYFRERYADVVGSEFLQDGTINGQVNVAGVRCEDMTNLTFSSDVFDAVMSFDVLEHIPDFRQAFAEVLRVLKPGGKFIWTAPFAVGFPYSTLIRARMTDQGDVEHLEPPEFHGDPLSDGVLCFQHFGWDVLDLMREVGYASATVNFYWSQQLGHMGGLQYVVLGEKA